MAISSIICIGIARHPITILVRICVKMVVAVTTPGTVTQILSHHLLLNQSNINISICLVLTLDDDWLMPLSVPGGGLLGLALASPASTPPSSPAPPSPCVVGSLIGSLCLLFGLLNFFLFLYNFNCIGVKYENPSQFTCTWSFTNAFKSRTCS